MARAQRLRRGADGRLEVAADGDIPCPIWTEASVARSAPGRGAVKYKTAAPANAAAPTPKLTYAQVRAVCASEM